MLNTILLRQFQSSDYWREIEGAYLKIDPIFRDSPQFVSETFSDLCAAEVTLKIETINPIGCFKGRGAEYLLAKRLKEFQAGIVAASAGNFGQGLAYVARKYGIACTIFAPQNANTLKIERIKSFGAKVILIGDDFDEAKKEAKIYGMAEGLCFIEDGKEAEITKGAATIAYELLRESEHFDAILVPLGNGSLLSGIASLVKAVCPSTRMIGVCAEGAPAMANSFQRKRYVETSAVNTIADGIAVRTPVLDILPNLFNTVDEVVLISDKKIEETMQLLYNAHRLLVEPAGIVGLAAILSDTKRFKGMRIATPLCGANLTSEQIQKWIVRE